MTPPTSPSPAGQPRILIIDDDAGQRSLLTSFLKSQGFETLAASSGEQALEILRQQPVSMMISDVRMPGISGLETLRQARRAHTTLPVLLVTAYADVRDAVGAMRDGAVNYLTKPIDLDELLASVRHATGTRKSGPPGLGESVPIPVDIVAESPSLRAAIRDASLIAASESRVLITGESGVGKEVLVDLIHRWSLRPSGPLVKVNCAAIPEALLESELFGHEKGAFTGAAGQRIGRFEEARDGTIFLDEVSEMSSLLQAKLLRVTQDGGFQRLGSNVETRTNARILAATNRDLEDEVRQGRFREDLFYRLNVFEIHLLPLRERSEDILPLAAHFVLEFTGSRPRFSAALGDCLRRYAWPGNVRELRNAMERATLMSRGEMILPEHLPTRVREGAVEARAVEPAEAKRLEEIEREAILAALRKHGFNRTETARALDISRRALVYKLQRYREQGVEIDPA